MPFIHVKSPPLDPPVDLPGALDAVRNHVASASGIDPDHFTATWHEVPRDAIATIGPHILVDLLLPDRHGPDVVGTLMVATAEALALHAGVDESDVFINAAFARSGMVFDGGRVIRWD